MCDTLTPMYYTLSLHDALPIYQKELTKMQLDNQKEIAEMQNETQKEIAGIQSATSRQQSLFESHRSEERFSRNAETDLVCRLLLEKKKRIRLHELNPDLIALIR